MKIDETAIRADRLRKWVAELELCIAAAKDCNEDTSEYELSLVVAQEELEALK